MSVMKVVKKTSLQNILYLLPRHKLAYVPDHFKTQGMCIKAVEVDPCTQTLVPDQFKTQEMCKKSR